MPSSADDHRDRNAATTRRAFVRGFSVCVLAAMAARVSRGQSTQPTSAPMDTSNIQFEKSLKKMRLDLYRHPPTDIIAEGFRPVGGSLADFAIIRHQERYHVFYIERRLQEGTPFFPGHEIFFGHASTSDFFAWEVHDPVMLIRPDTWEEAHVWAPFVMRYGEEYVMVYTGLNRHMSQDIGVAFSRDLFEWKRSDGNPISPCKNAPWAAWWPDEICSCRDPSLMCHDGRIWMTYTANTKEGASCVALASTEDFRQWKDHGPILIGPVSGYEPRLWAGHPQGSLESSYLLRRKNRWFLIINASIRNKGRGCWIAESDRMDKFQFDTLRPFWKDCGCIELVRDRGSRSLLAGLVGGRLKFGQINWDVPEPIAEFVTREQLVIWQ